MLLRYDPLYCKPTDFSKTELKILDNYMEIPEKIYIVNNELILLFYPFKINMDKLLKYLHCNSFKDLFNMELYTVYRVNELIAYRLIVNNKNLWIIL